MLIENLLKRNVAKISQFVNVSIDITLYFQNIKLFTTLLMKKIMEPHFIPFTLVFFELSIKKLR